MVDRDEVSRGQRRVLPWKGHVGLILPFLPVCLYGVDGRRDLIRVYSCAQALVRRPSAVRGLGDVGPSAVGVHEA